jgi:8-oxo-dGTP diphosphatase
MPTPALVTLLVFIGLMLRYLSSSMSYSSATSSCIHGQDRTWHGGHPAEDRPGQCWCGGDEYCMCTPSVAIDVVLYSKRKQGDEIDVWAVRRGDTGQLATIGGFVDVGETTENAVQREVAEETGIVSPSRLIQTHGHKRNNQATHSAMKLIGVYSDPRRDNRRSIVSIAYALEFIPSEMTTKDGSNIPKAGDDAKDVVAIPLEEIGSKYTGISWYADHLTILLDFKEQMFQGMEENIPQSGELFKDVARSTCSV